MDVFGNAVVSGVKGGLQHTYVESLRSIILPAYEKANAELFKQLYDTFNKGTIACKCQHNFLIFSQSPGGIPISIEWI